MHRLGNHFYGGYVFVRRILHLSFVSFILYRSTHLRVFEPFPYLCIEKKIENLLLIIISLFIFPIHFLSTFDG